MRRFRRPAHVTLSHRVIAVGLALLTLVLGWLAVTPEAHAWLHGHAQGPVGSVAVCGHERGGHESVRQPISAPECDAGRAHGDRHVVGHADASASRSIWVPSSAPGHSSSPHPLTPADADADAGCVVQLFAQGVDSGLAPLVSVCAPQTAVTEWLRAPQALTLAPTRYLRQPERGPPTFGI